MNNLLQKLADNLVKKSIYNSDPNGYIHCAISVIGALLGNTIKTKDNKIYPNLYSALFGGTGQGKSSYAQTILEYVSTVENYKNKISKRENKKREPYRLQELKRKKECLKNDIEYIYHPNPEPYSRAAYYKEVSFFANDTTFEALAEYAAKVSHGNMCLYKDELGAFFDAFKKAGREEDRTTYNTLYTPRSKFVIRRKSKQAKIPVIHFPVMNLMGSTPLKTMNQIVASYKKQKLHDGVLARFQHIHILPEQTEENIPLKLAEEVPENFDKDFLGLLTVIIDQQIAVWKKKDSNKDAEEENELGEDGFITYIGNTKEAQEAFIEYANSLRLRAFKSDNIIFSEHLSRTSDYVLKIALIFHVIKRFQSGVDVFSSSNENMIMQDTMLEAIEYVDNVVKQAAILYSEEGASLDAREESNRILKYIADKKGNFYKKYGDNKAWTVRDLGRTMVKILPRKNNGGIDIELLSGLLDHLVDEGKLYSEEFLHPNKSIFIKYSLKSLDKPSDPIKPDDPKEYKLEKVERKQIEVVQYPNKEESSAHIEKLKSSIDVREYVKQYIKLDSKGLGLCPFHDDKNPSLSVRSNLFKCFACDAKGSIIDFIMRYNGVDLPASIKMLESYTNMRLEPKTVRLIDKIAEEATLSSNEAPYLKNRLNGRELPLNDSILYSRSVYYSEGGHKANYPAMLAKITNIDGEFIGLQRTYLNDEMSAKKDLSHMPNKKILGNLDNGYVNLIDKEENDTLIIGEGIETVLSLYIMLKDKNHIMYEPNLVNVSVYANLSSTNLPDLPKRFTKILIIQDNDIAGKNYAEGMREKYKDRETKIYSSWEGNDFNDLLTGNY
ncbi:Archaeal primase DnaG/twinkle, TOPRIM domain [uncultured Caudovirales phage]|jgi:hypothetical protein|uniref:Archaeal primase DnaG/twinkle, TOPRIM domain n=1 Tax=uncultured Caudovirales phage TaxID=2100421 RepID=A0A6J5RLA3_9CAUD|nr:Archaeal primase DnaG/twinkle, TOPRIM domain [uncultured Caudovirales phage]